MQIEGFERRTVDTEGAAIHLEHGGEGPPLLLLHGYPQTHLIWHRVAPHLAQHFHVICPDLRGYGDSAKPPGGTDHAAYSKRAMAQDMADVIDAFGYTSCLVAGHDRGARVAHRMALDKPALVERLCVMDIAPTLYMFAHTDQQFATGYYHWFFLIQPDGLPEHLIGADPGYYLREKLRRWAGPGAVFDPAAVEDYVRCFSSPAAIHASCEDYRAAATIDLQHDTADRGRRIGCPLLALWGARGFVNRTYDVPGVWRDYADNVSGRALDCGHFLPEEAPDAVCEALEAFFGSGV
ncbi:MAG TPA: alpha/beta hydrolase [Rhodocyclaceae bacterium]|nr:alpha/beta hydrolase [Rhodocyclaceae bacterium]HMZ84660.1 alpha/beta hydrolase [Rhodocyclaceae bacterium]HNC62334.1 alpha/beta hydrolase [Rhodocyclaceae bacterium]HNH13956.1 alpha/beta hydrolase [Rhodocyclaceae bacterium]HNI00162.1 alpha/beta hydrolase [Rhodocyclaceae bacterium]